MGVKESNYIPEVLELLHQSWTIEIKPYSDGGYFARVVELRGCMTEADTLAEVVEAIEEARAEWLASALEHGDPIPSPQAENEYSGKIFVRTSSQLHRAVAEEAARRGVSMSQWVSEILAAAVGLGSLLPDAIAHPKHVQTTSHALAEYLASPSARELGIVFLRETGSPILISAHGADASKVPYDAILGGMGVGKMYGILGAAEHIGNEIVVQEGLTEEG